VMRSSLMDKGWKAPLPVEQHVMCNDMPLVKFWQEGVHDGRGAELAPRWDLTQCRKPSLSQIEAVLPELNLTDSQYENLVQSEMYQNALDADDDMGEPRPNEMSIANVVDLVAHYGDDFILGHLINPHDKILITTQSISHLTLSCIGQQFRRKRMVGYMDPVFDVVSVAEVGFAAARNPSVVQDIWRGDLDWVSMIVPDLRDLCGVSAFAWAAYFFVIMNDALVGVIDDDGVSTGALSLDENALHEWLREFIGAGGDFDKFIQFQNAHINDVEQMIALVRNDIDSNLASAIHSGVSA